MPEIENPYKEPPRQKSPGEERNVLADLIVVGARIFLKLEMSQSERDAVVTLLGLFYRWQNRT